MATVYQEDYDSFYETICRKVEYGTTSFQCACQPIRMTPEERKEYELRRIIELMKQPHDEAISLSGREYGDFIDKHYKATFIELKKKDNRIGIYDLIDKIAAEIKREKAIDKENVNTMFINGNPVGSSSGLNSTEKDLAEIYKMATEMSSKTSWSYKPTKKKSLWDKLKDLFE